MTFIRRLLVIWAVTLVTVLAVRGAFAASKRTIVMVLDTSGSMAVGSQDSSGKSYPATDPERLAVLGTQMILSLKGDDDVSVFGFPNKPIVEDELPSLPFDQTTPYLSALKVAGEKLASSQTETRVLIFFTDGAPNDGAQDLNVLRAAMKPIIDGGARPVIIGLVPHGDGLGYVKDYLVALGGGDEANTTIVEDSSKIVEELTQALARAFDSRARTGDLTSSSFDFNVDAGIDEVLITVAGESPGYDFQAQLDVPSTVAPVLAGDWRSGWNDTNHGKARYWQTLRYKKPAGASLPLKLRLLHPPKGTVRFGIIYKYELVVRVHAEPAIMTDGDDVVLVAQLVSDGKPLDKAAVAGSGFHDPQFVVGGVALPQVVPRDDGSFRVTWQAKRPRGGGPVDARVTFQGDAQLSSTTSLTVQPPTSFELHVRDSIDLHSWTGVSQWFGTPASQPHCDEIDLAQSPGAQGIPMACDPEASPPELGSAGLRCEPLADSRATGVGEPLKWRVCVDPKPCCGLLTSVPGASAARIVLHGREGRYRAIKATVPVYFNVAKASWLQCYWHWLAMAAGAVFAIWIIRGIVTPLSFESAAAFHVASTEAGLRKNQANVACEAPGGRRGFYRNARIALNASGDLLRDSGMAILVVEADRGAGNRILRAAGLEKKDARTGKWAAVPEKDFAAGLLSKAIYRVGQLYVKWE